MSTGDPPIFDYDIFERHFLSPESDRKGLVARDRFRRPGDLGDIFGDTTIKCAGCRKITTIRECWGCHKYFCYECLIEHMMGCEEWLKVKGEYDIIFECGKHKTCETCPYRFKCYTQRRKPKDMQK